MSTKDSANDDGHSIRSCKYVVLVSSGFFYFFSILNSLLEIFFVFFFARDMCVRLWMESVWVIRLYANGSSCIWIYMYAAHRTNGTIKYALFNLRKWNSKFVTFSSWYIYVHEHKLNFESFQYCGMREKCLIVIFNVIVGIFSRQICIIFVWLYCDDY